MEKVKSIGLTLLKYILALFVGSLIISILHYLFLSKEIVNIISLLYMGIILFLFGYKKGKISEKKGYLEGLKQGLVFILILIILNLLFYQKLPNLFSLFYYLILLGFSCVGATIGINKKNN